MLPVWESCSESVWLYFTIWDSKIFGKKSLDDNDNIHDCEYANGICSFIPIFNIIFHPWKCCYAPCAKSKPLGDYLMWIEGFFTDGNSTDPAMVT